MSCRSRVPVNTPMDFQELVYPHTEGSLPPNFSVMKALAPYGVTVTPGRFVPPPIHGKFVPPDIFVPPKDIFNPPDIFVPPQ